MSIQKEISEMHEGDERQLNVIFSKDNRVIVEAPAGYGKTTTMISRLAYLIAMSEIPYPKKVLVLTFSVNAALKVKRDVAEKLPILLEVKNNPNYVNNKLLITNFHGFCKGILKKYGYLINPLLKNLDAIQAIGDEEIPKQSEVRILFTENEFDIINEMQNAIKQSEDIEFDKIINYNKTIEKMFLLGKITHNAIILLTLQLFKQFPMVLRFYQHYFPLIVIDEYQDTNNISWTLIDELISNKTNLLFMGDSLQRIYGFIGAYPNIMSLSATKYGMSTVVLDKNYRFRDNKEMLLLDRNIRKNASDFNNPHIEDVASLPYFSAQSQIDEAEWVANLVQQLLKSNSNNKVAVLVKGRGRNTEIIEEELKGHDIEYFYALYKDDDQEYVDFHRTCLEIFTKTVSINSSLSKTVLQKFVLKVKQHYEMIENNVYTSLLSLLEALVDKVTSEYKELTPEDRRDLIVDIFENRQLKQAMEYVPTNVIFSTVHGAKGLEWDFVILSDVERYIIPFFTTCKYCMDNGFSRINHLVGCKITSNLDSKMEKLLLEELCVFYVAITRARKQVFISSSNERFNASGRQFSDSVLGCLASLDGINLVLPSVNFEDFFPDD